MSVMCKTKSNKNSCHVHTDSVSKKHVILTDLLIDRMPFILLDSDSVFSWQFPYLSLNFIYNKIVMKNYFSNLSFLLLKICFLT